MHNVFANTNLLIEVAFVLGYEKRCNGSSLHALNRKVYSIIRCVISCYVTIIVQYTFRFFLALPGANYYRQCIENVK